MGSRAIDMITELKKMTVRIRDPDHVEKVVTELVQGGKDKLQVVADFDFTLSSFMSDGKRVVSCHKAFDDSPRLPNLYREKATKLRNHYYPLEIDPQLTAEEKYPLMVEWWTQSHDLLIPLKLTKNLIRQIVEEAHLVLRDGCTLMFEDLHDNNVPILIFSAGLGDIIKEAITQQTKLYSNMKIVSNFMKFDEQGTMIGFQDDLIHTLNKNESAVHKSDYFQNLKHRENVILLGDSLGDLRMADGAKHVKNVLKIGFLNDKVEERMESYLNAYDIVLISDETMEVPNAILQQIFQ